MTVPLHFHTITELAPLVASGHVSSEDLTKACLAEIEAHNEALHAFITVTADEALAQARERDARRSRPAAAAARCTAFRSR